eukprot:9613707-Lingulodinium_polyedra.AAC.1
MAVLNQSKRVLKEETKLRDPRVMRVMLDAAREVVRHRGLRIEDLSAQQTTMKAVSRQAEELAKESSAKAGDLGRAG